jgi:hypothetical protein
MSSDKDLTHTYVLEETAMTKGYVVGGIREDGRARRAPRREATLSRSRGDTGSSDKSESRTISLSVSRRAAGPKAQLQVVSEVTTMLPLV